MLSPEWVQYLALPAEIQDPAVQPNMAAFDAALARFEAVATGAQYQDLAVRPEFQSVRQLLREYVAVCHATAPTLVLPAPPAAASAL
jgi:uncharacterized membrane protein